MQFNTPTAKAIIPVREAHASRDPKQTDDPPHVLEPGVVLAIGSEGRMYVGLPSRRAIYMLQDGNVLVPWCAPSSRITGTRSRPEALGGVGVSPDGEVWLSDTANHRVVRLDVANRRLVPIAGGRAGRVDGRAGEARLRGPGVMIMTSDVAAIVEEGSSHLRQVRRDGTVTTLGTYAPYDTLAPRGELGRGDPRGLALDAGGRILVYDAQLRTVFRFDDGDTRAVLGVLPAVKCRWRPEEWDEPEEYLLGEHRPVEGSLVAADRHGNIFVADDQAHRIFKLDGAGRCEVFAGRLGRGLSDRRGDQALFDRPVALALRADGALVVSDAGNHRLRLVQPDGTVTTLAGGPRGDADGPAGEARFISPGALAVAPDGTIWLVDGRCRVCRIDQAGNVATVYRVPAATDRTDGDAEMPFDGPLRLAAAPDGTLYTLEPRHNRIRRIDDAGHPTTLLWWQPNLATREVHGIALDDIAIDDDGRLFAIDGWSGAILEVDPHGVAATIGRYPQSRGERMRGIDLPDVAQRLPFSNGLWLACDAEGGFHVADGRLHRVAHVGSGAPSQVAGGMGGTADGRGPLARFKCFGAFGRDGGNDLIAITWPDVRRLDRTGMSSTLVEAGRGYRGSDGWPYRNAWPAGFARDPAGTWWFADLKHQALVAFADDTPGFERPPDALQARPSMATTASPTLERLEDLLGATLMRLGRPAHANAVILETDRGWAQIQMDSVSCPCCYGFRIVRAPGTEDAKPVMYYEWQPARITSLTITYDATDQRPHLHGLTCEGGFRLQVPGRAEGSRASLEDPATVPRNPPWADLAGRQLSRLRAGSDALIEVHCLDAVICLATSGLAEDVVWKRREGFDAEWTRLPGTDFAGAVVERVVAIHDLATTGESVKLILELDDGTDIVCARPNPSAPSGSPP